MTDKQRPQQPRPVQPQRPTSPQRPPERIVPNRDRDLEKSAPLPDAIEPDKPWPRK